MDDSKAIEDAYEGVIDDMFKVLYFGVKQANGDAAAETQAKKAFTAGLTLARRARALALDAQKAA